MTWVGTGIAVGGITGLAGGYLGAEGSRDAAAISSEGDMYAADIQQQQWLQNRRDLMPWTDVALGEASYDQVIDPSTFDDSREGQINRALYDSMLLSGQIDREGYRLTSSGARTETGREGGSLQELAGYGRSQVAPGEYIPASNLPAFDPQSNVQDFDIYGGQPEYNPLVDMSRDPGVQFRQQEQERAINRNMAGMGKVLSGNRLEELMARSGDLASQEYGAAYGRGLQDYELDRAREATTYGRDVTGFDYGRAAESDRYGRDLTAYDAGMAKENLLYGRGVADYGRAYGEEADYLNRLANLSNVGQIASTNIASQGTTMASGVGSNISSAADARAAGVLGQTGAWQGALGDVSSLVPRYLDTLQQPQVQPSVSSYTLNVPTDYGTTYHDPSSGFASWDAYG